MGQGQRRPRIPRKRRRCGCENNPVRGVDVLREDGRVVANVIVSLAIMILTARSNDKTLAETRQYFILFSGIGTYLPRVQDVRFKNIE